MLKAAKTSHKPSLYPTLPPNTMCHKFQPFLRCDRHFGLCAELQHVRPLLALQGGSRLEARLRRVRQCDGVRTVKWYYERHVQKGSMFDEEEVKTVVRLGLFSLWRRRQDRGDWFVVEVWIEFVGNSASFEVLSEPLIIHKETTYFKTNNE